MEIIKTKGYGIPVIERVLSVLPEKYRYAYQRLCEEEKSEITEIRLRVYMPCSFTCGIRNIAIKDAKGIPITSSTQELSEIIDKMCEGSVYSYSEHIRCGYIPFCGTRVGIAGRVCTENNSIITFNKITAINIRIPRYITDAAADVLKRINTEGIDNIMGVIAISPPNCGKTTFLRSLAAGLSGEKFGYRVEIADEREEIYNEKMFRNSFCDVISGCPKAKAIEIATRSLSPQIIVCDEVGSEEEARKLFSAYSNGVYLAASFHGKDLADVLKKKHMRKLIRSGVFKTAYVLERVNGRIKGKTERIDVCSGN